MNRLLTRFLFGIGLSCDFLFMAQAQPTGGTMRVTDAASGQPVPFASVGVRHRPLGTVADAAGAFPLSQVGAAATDTIVVSCIGYEPLLTLASQLGRQPVLRLTPQRTQLAEVVVRGRKPRRILLGHNWVSAFSMLGFYTQTPCPTLAWAEN